MSAHRIAIVPTLFHHDFEACKVIRDLTHLDACTQIRRIPAYSAQQKLKSIHLGLTRSDIAGSGFFFLGRFWLYAFVIKGKHEEY